MPFSVKKRATERLGGERARQPAMKRVRCSNLAVETAFREKINIPVERMVDYSARGGAPTP